MTDQNDPHEIREQIEATRERIADTAEALAYKTDVGARTKEKISARVEGVKTAAKDAASAVSSKVSEATETTKQNVAGLRESAKSTLSDATESAKSTLAGGSESARSAIAGAAQNVQSAASGAAQRVRSAATGAAQSAMAAAGGASDAAQDRLTAGGATASDLAQRARDLSPNPLAIAIGSAFAGFLVGLALPVSDLERENVGPLGDRVANEAKAKASDLAEQGKAAVASAVSDAFSGSKPKT